MKLNTIKIENFRNITALAGELAPGVNVFFGNNGSGKTNLLEAIFVLCLGRSHRAALERVMIRDSENYYRLEGLVDIDGRQLELAVAYQLGGRKRATIDKVAIRLPELYSNFAAVAAGPEDSEILSGSPSIRRNFIDVYLSQYSGKYLSNLTSYQKVLHQKNAALKKQMDPEPFDELLVQAGASVMKDRLEYLIKVGEVASEYYRAISSGGLFGLEYKPSVKIPGGSDDVGDIAASFAETIAQNAERERVMETGLVGPHRDDIYFSINDLPARSHGSQGEWRTAAISLKLAVFHLLKQKRGFHPILLLDEIFAELDLGRAEALMAAFSDFGQLFLTTAVEPPEFIKENSRSYCIADGTIVETD